MSPKKTQIFASKRKSNSKNGFQAKKVKKNEAPVMEEDCDESNEENESERIRGLIKEQLNEKRISLKGDSKSKPKQSPVKGANQNKKKRPIVADPESNDDEDDDDKDIKPKVAKSKNSHQVQKKQKLQPKPSAESSEEDDDEDEGGEDEEEEDEDFKPQRAKSKKSNQIKRKSQPQPAEDSSESEEVDDEELDESDDDGLDQDADEDSSLLDEADEDADLDEDGDEDAGLDEDGDEETGGLNMESDPESEEEPMEISSKKPSITAARKNKAETETDDDEEDDIPQPEPKSGKSKLKKLSSDSEDSEDEEEKPAKKKTPATKVDGKQIDDKLEEIFDTYKTTEAEIEQFRENYVKMVRSWLFIPRVAIGATVEDIRSLHPKISKVKLPTKTKEGKNFAFLNFPSSRDAEEVLKDLSKQKCVVADEPVKVQKAREFGMTPPAYINRKKLTIIACPKETTQEELCKLFPQATTVWLSKNARTDTVENFLSFPDEAIAKEALKENATVSLHGKCCALFFDNYSYKKKTASRKLKKKLGSGKSVDVANITQDAPKKMKKFQNRDGDRDGKSGASSSNLSDDKSDQEGGFKSNFRGGFRGGRGGCRGNDRDGFQHRGRGSFGRGRGSGSDRGGRGGFGRGGGGGGFSRGGGDGGRGGGFNRGGRGGGFNRGDRGGSDRGGRGGFSRGGRGGFNRGRGGSDRGGRGGFERGGRGSFGRGRGGGGFNRRTQLD